jgi:hypothetical protein
MDRQPATQAAKKVRWTRHRFACAARECATEAVGATFAFDAGGKGALFESPPGWFFSPIDVGVAFFCSIGCTEELSNGDVVKQFADRVRCKHCDASGMATRLNGPHGERIVAPPSGWSGFVIQATDSHSVIHLACSRKCLRAYILTFKLVTPPRPTLRLV